MVAIGGFRSDLSITCKTDGNFGNVSVLFFKPSHTLALLFISKSLKPIFFATIAHTVKQMGRKSNCLLVKKLNVETKRK